VRISNGYTRSMMPEASKRARLRDSNALVFSNSRCNRVFGHYAIHLHDSYLSLGTLAWAAAVKDEGLNPTMILEMAERFGRYRQADLDTLSLHRPLDITKLSAQWRGAIAAAKALVTDLPPEQIGCVFLNESAAPSALDSDAQNLTPHFGSVGGAWPRLAG
jgi:hypothetical protein